MKGITFIEKALNRHETYEKQLCKMLRPNFRKKKLVFRKIKHRFKYFIDYKQHIHIGHVFDLIIHLFIGEILIESKLCSGYLHRAGDSAMHRVEIVFAV